MNIEFKCLTMDALNGEDMALLALVLANLIKKVGPENLESYHPFKIGAKTFWVIAVPMNVDRDYVTPWQFIVDCIETSAGEQITPPPMICPRWLNLFFGLN